MCNCMSSQQSGTVTAIPLLTNRADHSKFHTLATYRSVPFALVQSEFFQGVIGMSKLLDDAETELLT